jgi:hypothetical protein
MSTTNDTIWRMTSIRWATFVKTITGDVPGGKNSLFAKCQEACRKDVERAFGVLQARFVVVRFSALTWSKTQMWETMNACVIMHNMIIESEREHLVYDLELYHRQGPLATVDHQVPVAFASFLAMHQKIRDANTHRQLQDDTSAQRKQHLVLFVIHLFGFQAIICMYEQSFE